jgi:hypothetical protein
VAFLSATLSLDDFVHYLRSDFVALCCSDIVAHAGLGSDIVA